MDLLGPISAAVCGEKSPGNGNDMSGVVRRRGLRCVFRGDGRIEGCSRREV